MILKLTFTNEEKHDREYFGEIFHRIEERPHKDEILTSVDSEKYRVKDVIISPYKDSNRSLHGPLIEYILEKL